MRSRLPSLVFEILAQKQCAENLFGGLDRLDDRKIGKRRISSIEVEALVWKHFFLYMKSTYISIRKCVVADVASPLSYLKLVIKERKLLFCTKDQR